MSRGKRLASLILFRPIIFSVNLSNPRPNPPCGGNPYLKA